MTITWIGSPNYDDKRKPIDRIVIHWMVGTMAAADAQFQKPGGTSAHYGVEGKTIHQYVTEGNVAYHAGNYAMNQRSIGIEHSAAPDRPATDETYATSAALIADIAKRRGIPLDRQHVIRHSEVVPTQCCGTVDVDRLIREALIVLNPMPIQTEMDKITQHDAKLKTAQDVLDKFTFYDGVISRKDAEIGQLQKAYDLLKEESQRLRVANYELDQKLADTINDCQQKADSKYSALVRDIAEICRRVLSLKVISDVREQLRRSGKS